MEEEEEEKLVGCNWEAGFRAQPGILDQSLHDSNILCIRLQAEQCIM